MTIEVVTHRILVKPHNVLEVDPAYKAARAIGLDVAGTSLDREQKGIDKGVVLSMGPTCFDQSGENPLKVGDVIVWVRHAGYEVVDPDSKEKLRILNDDDVVGIIREKEDK